MEQAKRTQSRSEQEKHSVIAEFEKAGNITVKDYCKIHQIHPATFYNWQKRYRAKTEPKGFVPVSVLMDDHSSEEVLFAEVRGIKIYQWVEAAYLKKLLN